MFNVSLLKAFGLSIGLLASDLAFGQNCEVPLTPLQRSKVKFHPGHYVAVSTNHLRFVQTLEEIKNMPNVVGIQKRYFWSNLHGPRANDFNFDKIISDINLAASKNKKLSIMIMTKFKAIGGISPVPAYVDSLTSKPIHYVMGGANLGIHANGWLAAFDNPVVVQEFNRFMRKLSETIDSKNAVANIVFNETAMGVTKESLDTAYHQNLSSTQEQAVRNGYINGVIALTRQASCAFKHTPVIQLTNFPTSRLEDLTNSHLQWTVGMGGADIWLRDPSIEKRFSDANDKRLKAYDYYPKMAGKLPIGLIAAGGNYLYESHDPETMKDATLRETQTLANRYDWSPERITYELANKAIVQLRANYIFWSKLSNQGDKHYRAFINQVNKIGTSHQTIKPVVKECPSNYGGRCVQNL